MNTFTLTKNMMAFNFTPTEIPEVILVTPQVFGDERWFFIESYHKDQFTQWGIDCEFIQDNHSKSKKWVFRWFHFQTQYTQAKLVRVTAWSVLDFAIDIRVDSATFGQHIMVLLSAENKQQLFVPKGFAHGFLTLEDNTEFLYKCDDIYAPEYDSGIVYNDSTLWIDRGSIMKQYNITELTLSEKDKQQQTLEEYKRNPIF
jgi:dTDP-4-dehydrorhamnose 3,5-epimerase